MENNIYTQSANELRQRELQNKIRETAVNELKNELKDAGILTGIGVIGGAAVTGGAMLAAQALLPGESSGQVGEIGSNPGLMGVKTPYVILKRNKDYIPSNLNHMYGEPSNEYVKLANCHGYTKVKDVHIEISCTQDERAEIESLLKQGVIL